MTEHIENSGGGTIDDTYDANTENGYSSTPNLYTLSSTSDVESFLNRFNRENGYKDSTTNTTLKLGDQIAIKDGTYNVNWYVAGFDVEKTRAATDGTLYDNGYGIALIPVNYVTTGVWDQSTSHKTSGTCYQASKAYNLTIYGWTPYTGSSVDTFCNNTMITALQTVLGDHIVNRNVLLADAMNTSSAPNVSTSSQTTSGPEAYFTDPVSSSYAWTARYGTLMSTMQIIGEDMSSVNVTNNTNYPSGISTDVDSYGNKYDQGEANYKLPLFDNIGIAVSTYPYWMRAHIGRRSVKWITWTSRSGSTSTAIAVVDTTGTITYNTNAGNANSYRPMIYIR